jgi:potassium-dependent mechanosensitive channel
MNQLLYLVLGWLGLLTRSSVLWQLLLAAFVVLSYRLWMLRHPTRHGSWSPIWAKLLATALLGLLSLAMPLVGLPGGLLGMVAQLLLIWTALSALRLVLRQLLPVEEVERYWQLAVAPLFVAVTLAGVLDRLDGLEILSEMSVLKLFNAPLSLGDLLLLISLPYFLVVLSDLPVALIGGVTGRLMGMGVGNRKAMELILRYFLIGLGVIWLADRIGLNGTAIAAIAGGLSVGLGFGIKEVFSNFVSGLWLLFEGSLKPGDVLLHEGDVCRVSKLGLRAATLKRKSDNAELVVPNQTFFTATTTTYTGTDDLRCCLIQIPSEDSQDPERVIALLLEVATAESGVLASPAPWAGVVNFGDYLVHYGLKFWMADPTQQTEIASALRRAILHRFREEGISLPKPP